MLKSTINHFLWILYNYRTAITSPNCTPLWFLIGLFVATIYFYCLLNVKNISLRLVLCFVGCVICSIIKEHVPFYLPWHIDSALVGMAFMYVGYIIKNRELLTNKLINWLAVILLLIIGSYSIINNSFIDVNIDSLGNIVLLSVGATSVSCVLLWIFKNVIRHNAFLEYLGKNTVIILAFNYAINSYSKVLFNYMSSKNSILEGFTYTWWMMLIIDITLSVILIFLWKLIKKYCLMIRKTLVKISV